MKYLRVLFVSALLLTGCSASRVYYELPVEFRFPEKKTEFINKHTAYLQGKKIFLDPGHGGTDRKNKGTEGLAVEADANLKVALFLRNYLQQAGAIVEMSRETDATVELKDRSFIANKSGADIFISIHHNAPGTVGDVWTNYTSTYYHALDENYEYEPCERDLARYVQRDLAYAMRNSGGPGSFDGTYSDYILYPGQGLSVLRLTEIPSILVECGFHTNLHEEQRLIIDEFNEIQAWGIFRGIARYFLAGIPEIIFLDTDNTFTEGNIELDFLISDSSGVDTSLTEVYFDSLKISGNAFTTDSLGRVKAFIPEVSAGSHLVRIIGANKKKNHSFPFSKEIIVLKK